MTAPVDPVTRYAERVLSGEVIAGPHVRDACQRHINDLETGHERNLRFNLEKVERVFLFFRAVLTVEVEREDEFGEMENVPVPFDLHESQEFILGSLFGWEQKNKKGVWLRRFRRAYIEQGKGNGKSPLAAGIGHYMLSACGKIRAEVYSAATDRDQASILFRDAVEMWQRSEHLFNRLTPSGINPVWQLTNLEKASFFKPISSEKKGKSGIRPYCSLLDEIHEHPNDEVIEMLRAGTKGNQEALHFEITNSGSSRESVCWDEHEYAIAVAAGLLDNDSFFSYVCALDKGDDPFKDESCWAKANPLLGVSIFPDFIRVQVQEAKGMPSKESLVRRLHFCQWTDSEESWISREAWLAVEGDHKLEDFLGRECYAGLDLSYTIDLTALALVFPDGEDPDGNPRYVLFIWFWKPKEGLAEAEKRDKVPYPLWLKEGELEVTQGKVIKLGPIAERLAWIKRKFDLRSVAYDPYRHKELDEELEDLGHFDVPLVAHPQGFRYIPNSELWMPTSVQEFENAIIEQRIAVPVNKLLRYNVAQTVVREDPETNKIFDKKKSRARIDGAVASAMAVGAAKERVRAVFDDVPVDELLVD